METLSFDILNDAQLFERKQLLEDEIVRLSRQINGLDAQIQSGSDLRNNFNNDKVEYQQELDRIELEIKTRLNYGKPENFSRNTSELYRDS